MPAIYNPEAEECEAAFLAYLEAQVTAAGDPAVISAPAELAGFALQPGRQYETRQIPGVIVNGADSKEREKGSRGVFDIDLEIAVISMVKGDENAEANVTACGVIIGFLNDKAPVKAAINEAGPFMVFDYFLKGSPRRLNQGGEWETWIPLRVVGRPG